MQPKRVGQSTCKHYYAGDCAQPIPEGRCSKHPFPSFRQRTEGSDRHLPLVATECLILL